MTVEKKSLLYEGKAKKVYTTNKENQLLLEFKNDLTAFNAQKKGSFEGKGVVNLQIAKLIFKHLSDKGIKTHWVEKISDNECVVQKVEIIPLEVVVRNTAAGSFSARLGIEDGTLLTRPVFEVFYKKDELNDPLLTREHVDYLNLCSDSEYQKIKGEALKIAKIMTELFSSIDIDLIDFKIEFGRTDKGEVILADEISPDSCRLWEKSTGRKMDKDRFRKDLGDVKKTYEEVLEKLKGVLS